MLREHGNDRGLDGDVFRRRVTMVRRMGYLTRPRLALILLGVSLVVALALWQGRSLTATTQAAAPCSRSEEFKHVPGQGPSCRLANGNWRIQLRDGTTMESHGPDPAAPFAVAASGTGSVSPAAATSAAKCVPTSDHYSLLIYANASDRANNFS